MAAALVGGPGPTSPPSLVVPAAALNSEAVARGPRSRQQVRARPGSCKVRALGRLWCRIMGRRYGAVELAEAPKPEALVSEHSPILPRCHSALGRCWRLAQRWKTDLSEV